MGSTTPLAFKLTHDHYQAAVAHFNSLPEHLEESDPDAFTREESIYSEASSALDDCPPGNWPELVQSMQHLIGAGSYPGAEKCDWLVKQARRLLDAPPLIGADDLYSLNRVMERIDQLAATLDVISDHADGQGMHVHGAAVRGVGVTLSDYAQDMDEVLEPHRKAQA